MGTLIETKSGSGNERGLGGSIYLIDRIPKQVTLVASGTSCLLFRKSSPDCFESAKAHIFLSPALCSFNRDHLTKARTNHQQLCPPMRLVPT